MVRNIALRDSLLAVRSQTIRVLEYQSKYYLVQKDSLLQSNLLLSNKLKKRRNERNALGFLFVVVVGVLIVL
ncbi:hypothetical protein [Raineya sp.]